MHRYVFVGGLHRSGTSLLARLIGAHPQVASIRDAPVPENEGCYLQGAIPHTAMHGRPMHFATDPTQHLTEGHPLDRLETRQRLEADWAPWFDPDKPWRVEKSPVNLTRMRLYQQLFPLSQFVVILRHPEAVTGAVGKWVDDPPARLIDHWIAAHARLAQDLPWLHAVMVLRYEDLIAEPDETLARVFGFMSLPSVPIDEPMRDGNRDPGPARMNEAQAAGATAWGYGPGLSCGPVTLPLAHPLRRVREAAAGR
ncbi:sulfotransferase family protein [Paracoccus sp. NSM]|uniref:sulfotransferase family protein n=1 Tax=Paracoccus sp. NSM TaxID=3457784 RepID=UPI0040375BBA